MLVILRNVDGNIAAYPGWQRKPFEKKANFCQRKAATTGSWVFVDSKIVFFEKAYSEQPEQV
jgi:hypothetical protein